MVQKSVYNSGDIFAIPVSQGFVFGQIIIDGKSMLHNDEISTESPLYFFRNCILFDLFDGIAEKPVLEAVHREKVLKGIFADHEILGEKSTQKIANRPVEIQQIDFPEFISFQGATDAFFVKGEIKIELPWERSELEKHQCRPTIHSSYSLGDIALLLMNREDMIPEKYRNAARLTYSDLRYNESASAMIYSAIDDEFMDETYFELAKRFGCPLDRFMK